MARKSGLEKFVDKAYAALDQGRGAGLAIAVVTDREVLLSKGYGYKRLDRKTESAKVDAHTTFMLGSVTKPFTSLAVMQAVESGVAGLESPVRYYDPDFALMDPHASEEASFEDILAQRCGVPRNDALWYMGRLTAKEIYAKLRYLEPDSQPGQGFRQSLHYNNLVFSSAGTLLEKVAKQSWSKLVQAVFDAVGMPDTTTTIRGLKRGKNWAEPHVGNTVIAPQSLASIAPAGAINSNVVDMAAWLQVVMRGGCLDSGERLISARGMKNLLTPRLHDVEGFGSNNSYALGWFVTRTSHRNLIWCPGNAEGYSAYVSFLPSVNLGVVVLVNQNIDTIGEELATEVYKHGWGDPLVPSGQPPRTASYRLAEFHFEPDSAPSPGAVGAAEPKPGRYRHSAYGELRITKSARKYQLVYAGKRHALNQLGHGGWVFVLSAYGGTYSVPLLIQDDPVAGPMVRIPFEPTTGWVDFLRK